MKYGMANENSRQSVKGKTVSVTVSPRADLGLISQSRFSPPNADKRVARADGLSAEEARQLASWLKSSGYFAIQLVQQGDRASVLWSK
jgi:hypothetical protein